MSTYKEKFNKKYKFPLEANHSLKEISELTGYKLNGVKVIFRKGKGAFFTNYSSVRPIVKKNGGVNKWAYARVYSAVMGGKARKYDMDHLIKK